MLRRAAGPEGDRMIAEQAVIAEKVIKAWSEDKKNLLRKYKSEMGELRKISDGINELTKPFIGSEDRERIEKNFNSRARLANDLLKALIQDRSEALVKAGVTTALGFNFIDLRAPAYLIYPVNTPFHNSMARWGKVNAGTGLMAQWKYTYLAPGDNYGGAAEGKRVATATPNENDAVSSYACLGIERAVTFEAEFASEGYSSQLADEHIRGLHSYMLQEESIIMFGNQGSATNKNGYQLGTANTPSTSVAASVPAGAPNDGGTGFANSTKVSVFVVEITALGNPNNAQYGYQDAPTVANGLVPSFTRNNADGTTDPINGGTGHISAGSNVSTALTATPFVLAKVAPKKGAFAWAWYVDPTDATTPTLANAFLTVITTVPYVYLGNATPGAQTGAATGLNVDHSAQAFDFSGQVSWGVNNGTFINMSDLTTTSPVTGATNNGLLNPGMASGQNSVPAVAEIEYDLEQQWNVLQAVADEIWCAADVKRNIQAALFTNTSGVPAYRFEVSRDSQGTSSAMASR